MLVTWISGRNRNRFWGRIVKTFLPRGIDVIRCLDIGGSAPCIRDAALAAMIHILCCEVVDKSGAGGSRSSRQQKLMCRKTRSFVCLKHVIGETIGLRDSPVGLDNRI